MSHPTRGLTSQVAGYELLNTYPCSTSFCTRQFRSSAT